MQRMALALLVILAGARLLHAAPPLGVTSPDGALALTFTLDDHGRPTYAVAWHGRPVILPSALGLDSAGADLRTGMRLRAHTNSLHDTTWKTVCGERAAVRDHYRELTVDLQASNAVLRLTFRAYDAGVALAYTLPAAPGTGAVAIARERTEFRFPHDAPCWAAYSGQGDYARVPLSAVKPGCERPLVVELATNVFVAVAEARLVDYARMKFAPLPGVPHALVSQLDGAVQATRPCTTPWRLIQVAETPGRLLEQNDIFLNLNDPCALADTSWIKPGKVIREVTLTTVGGKACVDFAVRQGLQYVEFDAGWYGHEYDDRSDARAVNLDPKRSKGPLDLQEVIRYGEARGIGIILYVNRRALERQLDVLLPLYQGWGVKGVKYGFVNVGPQKWTRWLHDAIRKAAAHRLMVDVHDEYRSTGYSRTYPNLMTMEGVHGDECTPSNRTTLAYVFTRFLAGPADNTVCYFDARVDRMASHAYQLAKPVCLFSPWQFLFWYDRPPAAPADAPGAGGAKPVMADAPELEFYQHLPTTWDDTRVLQGAIGQYAVIARRKGNDWFIGAMNAGQPRRFDVPLTFLPAGAACTAHIYTDDPAAATRTHVAIARRAVTSATVLQLPLTARGGAAIRLTPAAAGDAFPPYAP